MRNVKIIILIIFIFIPAGIFGQSWKQINSPSNSINGIIFKSNKQGWIIGPREMIYHTSDGGNTWKYQYGELNHDLKRIFFIDTLNGWASGTNGLIVHTEDGGNTWKMQDSKTTLDLWRVYFLNKNTGWIVGHGGEFGMNGIILKTTNSGEIWEKLSDSTTRTLIGVYFLNDKIGWAAGSQALFDGFDPPYMISTTDGGNHWTEIKLNFYVNFGPMKFVHFYDEKTGWTAGWNGSFYRTDDGGNSWKFINPRDDGRSNGDYTGLVVLDTNNIWVSTLYNIFHTINGGKNWIIDTIPQKPYITAISILDNKNGWLVTTNGQIWKYSDEPLIVNERGDKGQENILYNNYPNPANPTTNIQYYIAKESDVKIAIYDILGREILLLINESKKPGLYSTVFNGTKYPSGIYFYRLTANGFSQTKKVLLLK